MHYTLDFTQSLQQCVKVYLVASCQAGSHTFYLPRWRPGRYVMQNFERLISDVQASDETGQEIDLTQTGTHSWSFHTEVPVEISLTYLFYCNNSDAGGSYVDQEGVYINGINLFLYLEPELENPCTLALKLPEGYTVSGGMQQKDGVYQFSDFHQLVDSPFFAAKNLLHHSFEVAGIPTHLWFQGDCKPHLEQIEKDFIAYSEAQIRMFGEFPVAEYHYLYIMLPYHYRHGVEHYNSTVIAMGPGHRLMHKAMYKSFLEISSHELFHTWNVKALRPAEMYPYAYGKENYTKLHYITEGITTYYGDLMLWKGKVWSINDWVAAINAELMRHYGMGGKDFVSLEQASFNSWVNGYTNEGIPNRRISFYTKGNIVSMLIDVKIRQATQNQASLDTVVSLMYHRIAKANRGYTQQDYLQTLLEVSGISFEDFFEKYISGTEDLSPALEELGAYMGFQLIKSPPEKLEKVVWGLKSKPMKEFGVEIENLLPGSPLAALGLIQGDQIISINGKKIQKDLESLLGYYSSARTVELHYFHRNKLYQVEAPLLVQNEYLVPQFMLVANPSPEQMVNRLSWQNIVKFQLAEHVKED